MTDETEQIRRILSDSKIIAVVGLSPKPDRASYQVAAYLQGQGYRIIPINPGFDEILGERRYSSLLDVPVKVDIVNIFRRPEDVPPIVEDAVKIGAKVVWMQIGIVNLDAAQVAGRAGLSVIMDRCAKVEHALIFGS